MLNDITTYDSSLTAPGDHQEMDATDREVRLAGGNCAEGNGMSRSRARLFLSGDGQLSRPRRTSAAGPAALHNRRDGGVCARGAVTLYGACCEEDPRVGTFLQQAHDSFIRRTTMRCTA
jgi:hypothetical protein